VFSSNPVAGAVQMDGQELPVRQSLPVRGAANNVKTQQFQEKSAAPFGIGLAAACSEQRIRTIAA
jgi:hypothetical protein